MPAKRKTERPAMNEGGPAPVPPTIHLVAIGNEILNGETRETNLAWLIKFFTRRGGEIVCADVIPDDFNAVKRELTQAREAGIDLVVTTGGLGPTDDDATMAAIANYLQKPLKLDEQALGFVKERIEDLAKYRPGIPRKLTKERKGMAVFPDGGIPLRNPVGVAPGMMYIVEGTTLIVLPGVPMEMKGIVSETLRDFWENFFKGVCYVRRNIVLRGIPEAELAPFIRKVQKKDPGVYIKSRIRLRGKIREMKKAVNLKELQWEIILHFSVIECTLSNGHIRVDNLIDEFVADIKKRYKYPLDIDLQPGRV